MAGENDRTIDKTQWTDSLLEDLYTALSRNRGDDTVRAFARELIDDKGLPIEYLVRKVHDGVGAGEAERLDVLVRGRHAVEKSKAARPRGEGGVLGFLKRLFG